jgi:hypothetical protein
LGEYVVGVYFVGAGVVAGVDVCLGEGSQGEEYIYAERETGYECEEGGCCLRKQFSIMAGSS